MAGGQHHARPGCSSDPSEGNDRPLVRNRWRSRSIFDESLLVKHQLLILNRSRERALKLSRMDRVITRM